MDKIVEVKKTDINDFIKFANKHLQKVDLNDIEKINKVYCKLCTFIDKSKMDPYEVNNIIKNNKGSKLKEFVKIRNTLILEKILKSKLWKNTVILLKEDFKKSEKLIEKSLHKLFKSYLTNWLSFWTLVDYDIKNNCIKNIHIFDLNDKKKIENYLKKMY